MGKVSEGLKKWRSKQPRGAIMKPETFEEIKQEAEHNPKVSNPEAYAGGAYWKTAKRKYKKSKGKK